MSKLKTVLKPAIAAGLICVSATLALAEQNVIAKVGDMEITEQELAFAAADLQQEFAQVPADKRRGAVLSALIDIKLLAAKEKSKKIPVLKALDIIGMVGGIQITDGFFALARTSQSLFPAKHS